MLGDKEHPVRPSKLGGIVKCSMRVFMLSDLTDEDELGGEAAQTGNVVHAGVAAFHKAQGEKLEIRTQKGWEAIAKAMTEFPQAVQSEVRLFFEPYIADPRNIHAQIPLWLDGELAVEKGIEFVLPPHEIDETQQPIHVQGTFDQIRIVDNIPKLYDLKTGKISGWQMIHDYAIQLAAYTYGIRENYRKTTKRKSDIRFDQTEPGYIIRNYGYRQRQDHKQIFNIDPRQPDGVFWAIYKYMPTVDFLMELVRFHVGLYRNGYVMFSPGPHCTYCEHGGIINCTQKYQNLKILQR